MTTALSEKNWFLRGVHWGNCCSYSCLAGSSFQGHEATKGHSSSPQAGCKSKDAVDSGFSSLLNDKWLPRTSWWAILWSPTPSPPLGKSICQQPQVLINRWGRGKLRLYLGKEQKSLSQGLPCPLWQIRSNGQSKSNGDFSLYFLTRESQVIISRATSQWALPHKSAYLLKSPKHASQETPFPGSKSVCPTAPSRDAWHIWPSMLNSPGLGTIG